MCFDVEMNYTRFTRKQIITVNYSSQLKTRKTALILMAFSTMRFPDTLSFPLWIEGRNAAYHCDALRNTCFTSWNLWAKSFLPHSLLPGVAKGAGGGPFCSWWQEPGASRAAHAEQHRTAALGPGCGVWLVSAPLPTRGPLRSGNDAQRGCKVIARKKNKSFSILLCFLGAELVEMKLTELEIKKNLETQQIRFVH